MRQRTILDESKILKLIEKFQMDNHHVYPYNLALSAEKTLKFQGKKDVVLTKEINPKLKRTNSFIKYKTPAFQLFDMEEKTLIDEVGDFSPEAWVPRKVIENKYEVIEDYSRANSLFYTHRITNYVLFRDLVVRTPREGIFADYYDLYQDLARWKRLGYHQNILQLLYVEVIANVPRIFVEWTPNNTLEEFVSTSEFYFTDPHQTILRLFKMSLSIAKALQYAHHNKVLHMNLKPSNVLKLIASPGNEITETHFEIDTEFAITDFGNPWTMELENRREMPAACRQEINYWWPPYMLSLLSQREAATDLEQLETANKSLEDRFDHFLDIYSFGLILFYTLIGKRIWNSTNDIANLNIEAYLRVHSHQKLDQTVATSFAKIISQCLAQNEATKYTSFDEIINDLVLALQAFTNSSVQIKNLENKPLSSKLTDSLLLINDAITNYVIEDNSITFALLEKIEDEIEKMDLTHILSEKMGQDWRKVFDHFYFDYEVSQFLQGKKYDYQIIEKFKHRALYQGFMAFSRGKYRRACEFFKDALLNAKDCRLPSLLQLLRVSDLNQYNLDTYNWYGHYDRSDIFQICVSNECQVVLSVSKNDRLILWNYENKCALETIVDPNILAACMSGDGSRIAYGKRDGVVYLLNVTDWSPFKYEAYELKGHTAPVVICEISNDGNHGITCGFDHHMIVWDFNTTEQICNVELVAIPRALVLDNKQNFVIALGNAKNLSYCTYDKGTIQLLAELEGHKALITHAKITLDGDVAVTASLDRTLIVWALKRKKIIKEIVVEELVVNIELTLMGKYIAVKFNNNRIVIYESSTGIFMQSLKYAGNNTGMAIILKHVLFDYCPTSFEETFIDIVRNDQLEEIEQEKLLKEFVPSSEYNFLEYMHPDESKYEYVSQVLRRRFRIRFETLKTKMDRNNMVWLIIFTGNCTQFGNAVKVKLFEIPFIGINCSEIKSEHERTFAYINNFSSYLQTKQTMIVEAKRTSDFVAMTNAIRDLKELTRTEDNLEVMKFLSTSIRRFIIRYPLLVKILYQVYLEKTIDKGAIHYEPQLREDLGGFRPEHRLLAAQYYFNLRWPLFRGAPEVTTCLKDSILEISLFSISPDGNFIAILNNLNIIWIYQIRLWNALEMLSLEKLDWVCDVPEKAMKTIDLVQCLFLSDNAEYLAVGTEEGLFYVIHISQRDVVFVTKAHLSRITVIDWVRGLNSFITASIDSRVKIWEDKTYDNTLVFDSHFSAIDFLSELQVLDENNETIIQIVSIDVTGIGLVWDPHSGHLKRKIYVDARARYGVPKQKTAFIYMAYYSNGGVHVKILNYEGTISKSSLERITLRHPTAQYSNYPTLAEEYHKKNKMVDFFFWSDNGMYLCAAQKGDSVIRVLDGNFFQVIVKIILPFQLSVLIINRDFSQVIVSDGFTVLVYILEGELMRNFAALKLKADDISVGSYADTEAPRDINSRWDFDYPASESLRQRLNTNQYANQRPPSDQQSLRPDYEENGTQQSNPLAKHLARQGIDRRDGRDEVPESPTRKMPKNFKQKDEEILEDYKVVRLSGVDYASSGEPGSEELKADLASNDAERNGTKITSPVRTQGNLNSSLDDQMMQNAVNQSQLKPVPPMKKSGLRLSRTRMRRSKRSLNQSQTSNFAEIREEDEDIEAGIEEPKGK